MEENRKDKNQGKIVVSLVAVLALIIMVFGITYAVLVYTGIGKKENTLRTGALTFVYDEMSDGITIDNAYPMNDETGKALPASGVTGVSRGYFDFNVAATIDGDASIKYEVVGIDITDSLVKLDPKYVKVYLTNGGNGEVPMSGYEHATVPTFNSLPDANGGKRLYNGTFGTSGTQRFRLRLWVSNDYEPTGLSETFKMKVNVIAVA